MDGKRGMKETTEGKSKSTNQQHQHRGITWLRGRKNERGLERKNEAKNQTKGKNQLLK